jgi:uncharacterized protein YceK
MNPRLLPALFALTSLSLCSGCGTFSANFNPELSPYYYRGVRQDLQWLVEDPYWVDESVRKPPLSLIFRPEFKLCVLADLPLSAAMDTINLPVDILYPFPRSSTNAPTGNGAL